MFFEPILRHLLGLGFLYFVAFKNTIRLTSILLLLFFQLLFGWVSSYILLLVISVFTHLFEYAKHNRIRQKLLDCMLINLFAESQRTVKILLFQLFLCQHFVLISGHVCLSSGILLLLCLFHRVGQCWGLGTTIAWDWVQFGEVAVVQSRKLRFKPLLIPIELPKLPLHRLKKLYQTAKIEVARWRLHSHW